MKIQILNCNNIDHSEIEIFEGRLNIKYAINGTGKSTISKAIHYSLSNKDILSELQPFKHRGKDVHIPEVSGIESLKKVKVFDESYINEFVFQKDEILKNSFDIFIRDGNYEQRMQEIDSELEGLRKAFQNDADLDYLIQNLQELSLSFGKPVSKGIHASSPFVKAFKDGNKVVNIPVGLEPYKDFIQHTTNYKWVKWQLDGKDYVDISESCPYCTNNIQSKKSLIRKVGDSYEPKSVENLNKFISTFENLKAFLSDDSRLEIEKFISNTDQYTDDQINFVREIHEQSSRLCEKLNSIKSIGFYNLKDVDKVVEALEKMRIDVGLFSHLKSEVTIEKADSINKSIAEIKNRAGELQGLVNLQKRHIENLVKEYQGQINSFLKNAGYKYKVDLAGSASGENRLRLVHDDSPANIDGVTSHLSFGERNAFALVLFMYDALKDLPGLIVLDDPISSFDKNKKYAIVDMLFRKNNSFRGKTVLLLTHDFDPIVDIVLNHPDRFEKPSAKFLENDRGVLKETQVERSDIKTFVEICNENIAFSGTGVISKLIYLRRLDEISNNKGLAYHVLSNLLHKKSKLEVKSGAGVSRPMTNDEIKKGFYEVRRRIKGFDYYKILKVITDDSKMKEIYLNSKNNYEKLHLYRIIFDDKLDEITTDVIKKFINESFHIENNYIYQLNPRYFQLIPHYVIEECDKFVSAIP
jgi:ABC-type phosphate/phosphonate transport system ATPase subunit